MVPTIGRIVIYTPSDKSIDRMKENNSMVVGRKKLVAIIVGVNENDTINLRVIADGLPKFDMWVHNATKGDEEGQWNWPDRV